MKLCRLLREDERERDEEVAQGALHGAPVYRKKKPASAGLIPLQRRDYSPYILCFSSRRACASMESVAVGRAISRGMPIGSPVSSHQP